jgi:hypothetical protein
MEKTMSDGVQSGLNRSRLVAALLALSGAILAVMCIIWAVDRYSQMSRSVDMSGFLTTTMLLITGIVAAVLLWGLGELLRKVDDLVEIAWSSQIQHEIHHYRERAGITVAGVDMSGSPEDSSALEELLRLTRDLRDISLLSEEERAIRYQQQSKQLVQNLEKDVPRLLQEHNWIDAKRRISLARMQFPRVANWDVLERQIEEYRSKVEKHDIETVTRQTADLRLIGAWDRAEDAARELLERHPDSPTAYDVLRGLRFEREQAEAERVFAAAQDATHRHEWTEALSHVEQYLKDFPNGPRADDLRAQVPTLKTNQEIQIRHRMEGQFRELLAQHRFDEALSIGRLFLERYPHSPQAAALREQLPKLEQRLAGAAS